MTKKQKIKAIKDLKDRGLSNVAIARQLDLKPSEISKFGLEWGMSLTSSEINDSNFGIKGP